MLKIEKKAGNLCLDHVESRGGDGAKGWWGQGERMPPKKS